MSKQLSFPELEIIELDNGYTTRKKHLTVLELKAILDKFPDEMGVFVALPSSDFASKRVSGAGWVGKNYCPMTGTPLICIQSLSPSAIEKNRTFIKECEKKQKK